MSRKKPDSKAVTQKNGALGWTASCSDATCFERPVCHETHPAQSVCRRGLAKSADTHREFTVS
jgi:hypothetical protein